MIKPQNGILWRDKLETNIMISTAEKGTKNRSPAEVPKSKNQDNQSVRLLESVIPNRQKFAPCEYRF